MTEEKTTGVSWILVLQAVIRCALAILFLGLALFLPAGSLAFWNAWLFMGIFVGLMFFFALYLLRKDPVLLEKRLKATETEKPQRMAMLLLILAVLSTFVISGFDYKYHWSAVPHGLL